MWLVSGGRDALKQPRLLPGVGAKGAPTVAVRPRRRGVSEKDAKLARKLGQLQPFLVVFPQECKGQLGSFGQPNIFLAAVPGVGAGAPRRGGAPRGRPRAGRAELGHSNAPGHRVGGVQSAATAMNVPYYLEHRGACVYSA